MLERIEIYFRRLRNFFSRSRWLIKTLALDMHSQSSGQKGLVLIQIDALPKTELKKALSSGEVPFLKNLLKKQHYKLYSHYAGMPCSTAAVQAELFYGEKSAVPAFSFFDHSENRTFTMYNPADAFEIERRLSSKHKPLLENGSSYSNIYTGGAKESHFCIASLSISSLLKTKHPIGFFILVILNFYSLIRMVFLFVIEICLAVVDFFKGLFKKRDLWKELKFVPSRVAICVLLREFIVIGAKIDIARSMPIIHLNLMGYHEQSHRRGPTSLFAHWTLRGIDDAIKRIYHAAHRSGNREYDVWIYSDHGQIETVPYEKKFGISLPQAVMQTFDHLDFSTTPDHKKKSVGFLARAGLKKPPQSQKTKSKKPIITTLGPMAHIYLNNDLSSDEIHRFAQNLIKYINVPMVFFPHKNDTEKKVEAWTTSGHYILPQQANEVIDPAPPFYQEMLTDFQQSCQKENCGDLIVSGWDKKANLCYSFAMENGSHGSLNPIETEGFALFPRHTQIKNSSKSYIRPLDIRNAALDVLENRKPKEISLNSLKKDTLKVMTYNVHGCVGVDGKLSANRIANVISQYQPDVIALQELDVGRLRSGQEDQAMTIANLLNMKFHFHPTMSLAEELFGDAVLSAYPMKLMKKASLTSPQTFSFLEPRGAIWIRLDFNSHPVNIINTHLGLHSAERMIHSRELLGEKWIKHEKCTPPVILCGDFNSLPGSKVFRLLHKKLHCSQERSGRSRHKSTWFGRFPIACLDHIFLSPDLKVKKVQVADSHLARIASDHRPIIAEIKIKS